MCTAQLLELISGIQEASRKQQKEVAKRFQEERQLANDRLAACEVGAARLREELSNARAELREADNRRLQQKQEMKEKAAAEIAKLKAELHAEKQRAQQYKEDAHNAVRQRQLFEHKLQEYKERLERVKQEKDSQIGDLERALQDIRRAQHEREENSEVAAVIQQAYLQGAGQRSAQDHDIPGADSARRRLFSPSESVGSAGGSTFNFDTGAEQALAAGRPPPAPLSSPVPPVASAPPAPLQRRASQETQSRTTSSTAFGGCSPLFGVPMLDASPTRLASSPAEAPSAGSDAQCRGSVVSSQCTSSLESSRAPLITPDSGPGCFGNLVPPPEGTQCQHRSPSPTLLASAAAGAGRLPPSSATLPVPSSGGAVDEAASLGTRGSGIGPLLRPEGSRSSSRSSSRRATPPPPTRCVGLREAPPRGCVAEKVIIFERGCQTPTPPGTQVSTTTSLPEALRHGPRSDPVPTPLGSQRRSQENLFLQEVEQGSAHRDLAQRLSLEEAEMIARRDTGRMSISSASLASTCPVPVVGSCLGGSGSGCFQDGAEAACSTRDLLGVQGADRAGFAPAVKYEDEEEVEELVNSPPRQKECRRRLSWNGAAQDVPAQEAT